MSYFHLTYRTFFFFFHHICSTTLTRHNMCTRQQSCISFFLRTDNTVVQNRISLIFVYLTCIAHQNVSFISQLSNLMSYYNVQLFSFSSFVPYSLFQQKYLAVKIFIFLNAKMDVFYYRLCM